ncbi:MAG: ABC transporter ATP-binding protein [Candidatus Heimdallarchaeota archaeon]|nr:ABC transporter ATP-binding protein [Candidatus Heimdallarchaeota archaeon]
MTFIEIRDLMKIYQTKRNQTGIPALRGIELVVDKGEFISIIGPSGSGKTTLMLILAGMLDPTAGFVKVGDSRLDKLSGYGRSLYRRHKVGTLWQLPNRNLIFEITIEENVDIQLRLLGLPLEERKKRIKELFVEVGLERWSHHKPMQLSGGQVQRAGLACALAHSPSLLLADEPTGELDTKTAKELMKYFRHLNETIGITAIMVTHDFDVAKTSDRIIQIVDGRISGFSYSKNLRTLRDLNSVYLDRYGSMQLPRHITEIMTVEEEVKIKVQEKGKILLEQK